MSVNQYLNGKLNLIASTGGSGGASSAEDISYDNTASDLEATTVQEAIDEIKEELGGLSFSVNQDGILEISYGEKTE